MEMVTTAGVICLRSGASVGMPLVISRMGSGMLASAAVLLLAIARPNVTAPSSRFTMVTFFGGMKLT
jgi:hypothetical protein